MSAARTAATTCARRGRNALDISQLRNWRGFSSRESDPNRDAVLIAYIPSVGAADLPIRDAAED
jgi:hypothetical protein